jgi:hypothetical protein
MSVERKRVAAIRLKHLDGARQPGDLILETGDLVGDNLEVLRVLEVIRAAICCVETC